ncbi:tyrosine--tRNA ligase [Hymenobacter sp. BT559]|jgi:tyrosyl-tRNA synthetase|uniref:tyrosine--tRNA ligase n=1 Tax=Hymenobacter sp. BT559 TaxID=2795729 RepID=UPI0018EBC231|nr:tyrosine--tRNA ligase [Hymenobacter sp. BT559]MBJ6142999.1 tyrosine--tRNA ligase [Hymenobacter sp. BT559]
MLIEELTWRGMYHDAMPGTAEHLASAAPVSGYIGFDPTAASLHIGNLATIMLLVHLQRAGHRPVALVGGATGMIGDPSGKSAERNFLDENALRVNQAGIRAQLEKFLDFNDSPTGAVLVNNYDWFKEFGYLQFLREVGKHLTVNYMMAKDSVKRRINPAEGDTADGLSYTEFSYQLLQGYDFVHLYKTLGCTLQMGASDQWGNITTGTELLRRITDGEGKAYALTGKLITKADGTKYGKSETGTVWLDPNLTSPYQFYQFFLRSEDVDAPRLIRVFTLLNQEEIEAIEAEHAQNPGLKTLQKALAKDVTIRVHSQAAYEAAVAASEVLFGKGDLGALDEATLLDVFAGVPHLRVPRTDVADLNVAVLLSETTDQQILPSRGEVRKLVKANGLSVNGNKLTSPEAPVTELPLLHDKYLVVKKGKKDYYLVELT